MGWYSRIDKKVGGWLPGGTKRETQKTESTTTTAPITSYKDTRIVDKSGTQVGTQRTTTTTSGGTYQDTVRTSRGGGGSSGYTTKITSGAPNPNSTKLVKDRNLSAGDGPITEKGVMTLSPADYKATRGTTYNPAIAVDPNLSPSETVTKYGYTSNANFMSVNGKQTAGTFEYNYASLELAKRQDQGFNMDESEVKRAQQLARNERLGIYAGANSKDVARRNVMLTTRSMGVGATQVGVGMVNFGTNLYSTFGSGQISGEGNAVKRFHWGDANIQNLNPKLNNVMNAPNTPALSKSDYLSFSRPGAMTQKALIFSTVGAGVAGGTTTYLGARAGGATRAGAMNILGGEVLSFASPINIRSGVVGSTTTTSTPKLMDRTTTGGYGLGKGKTLSGSEGYYSYQATTTYGTIGKTLTGGTSANIKTVSSTGYQLVSANNIASSSVSGGKYDAFTQGTRTITNIDRPPVASGLYDLKAGPYRVGVTAQNTKIFSQGVISNKESFGTSKLYTTDKGYAQYYEGKYTGRGATNQLKQYSSIDYSNKINTISTPGGNLVVSDVASVTKAGNIVGDSYILHPSKGGGSSFKNYNSNLGGKGSTRGGLGGGQKYIQTTRPTTQTATTNVVSTQPSPVGRATDFAKLSTVVDPSVMVGAMAPAVVTAQTIRSSSASMSGMNSLTSMSSMSPITAISSNSFSLTSTSPMTRQTSNLGQVSGTVSTIPSLTSITPGRGGGSSSIITPITIVPGFPLPFGAGGAGKSGRRNFKPQAIKDYNPSFDAMVFKIRGTAPTGIETGLRTRPILSKPVKKRKRKK